MPTPVPQEKGDPKLLLDGPPKSLIVSNLIWKRLQDAKAHDLPSPLPSTYAALGVVRSCNLPPSKLVVRTVNGTPYSIDLSKLHLLTW